MYFVISAGGTAGHVNPALAVADELRRRLHEVLFVGTPDHIEAKLAKDEGFEFVGFNVSGFNKSRPLTLLSSSSKILKATRQAVEMFKERRPDAVLTFGAYVSIPVGRAALKLGIPLIAHEQNSVPGMANSYLAKRAELMALTYEESRAHLKCKNPAVVLGNPVRAAFETCSRSKGRELLGIPDDALVLLVMGGSLGAQHINRALCAMKERLLEIDNLYIVHSAGSNDYQSTLESLQLTDEQSQRWKVFEYIDQMGDVLAASDLVVSRAGASSLAEIMTLGIPAVLVPYPYARGDHQTLNAQSCVSAKAAYLVPDSEVEDAAFADLVLRLVQDKGERDTMAAASKRLSGSDARVRLADMAVDIAKGQ